ncbi:MAG: DUF1273 domain-containing protein [Clostridiales bacterium]|nr:DUF1273 domain-containing protein [Clostridiales bacterium]
MRTYRLCAPRTFRYTPKAADTLRQPLSFISREMIADVFDSELRGRKDLTVCFTGHRHIPEGEYAGLAAMLDRVLEALYQHGYRDFISGAAIGFDVLAAERVIALRQRHSDVQLRLAIPCATQAERWGMTHVERYERMVYHADTLHVLSPQYYAGCMQVRNRYMVDRSALCLCYLTHSRGGTMSTVAYAMQQECPVLNLAMEDACEAFIHSLSR